MLSVSVVRLATLGPMHRRALAYSAAPGSLPGAISPRNTSAQRRPTSTTERAPRRCWPLLRRAAARRRGVLLRRSAQRPAGANHRAGKVAQVEVMRPRAYIFRDSV